MGIKDYVKFLGEDPSSNRGLNEAKKMLELIRSISNELAKEKNCGRIVVSRTFQPRKEFAEKDRKIYGIDNESYTVGCTMLTDKSFSIEESEEIIKSVNFEKPLYELTEGGGPAFQLNIFGEVNEQDLQQLISDLFRYKTPVFKIKLL